MSPVIRDDHAQITAGDYWRNVRTGVMVQIMDVDLSGNCRVQDIRAPIDADPEASWQPLTASQITSCLWAPVQAAS